MAETLQFGRQFSNGVQGKISADLREMRRIGTFATASPAFRGGLPPLDEVEDWFVSVMTTIADYAHRDITCLSPSGAGWIFRPGKPPELIGSDTSKMKEAAAVMRMAAGVIANRTFRNGSQLKVYIDYSAEPSHIDLALFGKKPDASEMEAWLAPMLSLGEQCGVAVEEELERVGVLWWRKPRPAAADVVGHINDFFTLAFFHDENGGPGQ